MNASGLRSFWTGLLLAAVAMTAGFPLKLHAAEGAKLNVLFIFADDMRPDCIGALGNPHIKTPNLDKLVERGMSFTNTYVMGANSGAVCTPSRTMILSGRSVFHHSIRVPFRCVSDRLRIDGHAGAEGSGEQKPAPDHYR